MFQTKAEVKVKDGDKVIATQEYQKVIFHGDSEDANGKVIVTSPADKLLGDAIAFFQAEVGEKGNGVLEMLQHVTYSQDLAKRASIRQTLVQSLEGPEKAISKAIKDLMAARAAAGKPISEEKAREKVMAAMAD